NLGPAEDPTLISIPLDAEVGPSVSLVPNTVYVAWDQATGAYRPAQLMAIARRRGHVIGELTPVGWPKGVRFRLCTSHSERLQRYEIELEPGTEVPRAGLRLELAVANSQQRVELTLLPEELSHSPPLGTQAD
ncbi:MAG: hypothetical protein K6T86_20610, partial [Pirellulales bacterium]|nr:hypothetical protein [Pirellulales bacterium]